MPAHLRVRGVDNFVVVRPTDSTMPLSITKFAPRTTRRASRPRGVRIAPRLESRVVDQAGTRRSVSRAGGALSALCRCPTPELQVAGAGVSVARRRPWRYHHQRRYGKRSSPTPWRRRERMRPTRLHERRSNGSVSVWRVLWRQRTSHFPICVEEGDATFAVFVDPKRDPGLSGAVA